jgi:hypothetical protein
MIEEVVSESGITKPEVIAVQTKPKEVIKVKGEPDIPVPPTIERPDMVWFKEYLQSMDDEEALAVILMVA